MADELVTKWSVRAVTVDNTHPDFERYKAGEMGEVVHTCEIVTVAVIENTEVNREVSP